jgi:cell division topological specificity factor MinE
VFNALKKKLFGESNESKETAKSRLHFVLVQDRTGLTNEEMAGFREEMVKVIEKYFVIDKEGFDIKYHRLADTTTLLINSPVIVRRSTSGSSSKSSRLTETEPENETDTETAAVASNV